MPDYDYAEGASFHVFEPAEGSEATASVTDLEGRAVLTCRAQLRGKRLSVKIEGGKGSYRVHVRMARAAIKDELERGFILRGGRGDRDRRGRRIAAGRDGMGDSELEDERDALIQTVTEAYSRGAMEMPAFEKGADAPQYRVIDVEAELGLRLPVPRGFAVVPRALARRGGAGAASQRQPAQGRRLGKGSRLPARAQVLQCQADLTEYEGARRILLGRGLEQPSAHGARGLRGGG